MTTIVLIYVFERRMRSLIVMGSNKKRQTKSKRTVERRIWGGRSVFKTS